MKPAIVTMGIALALAGCGNDDQLTATAEVQSVGVTSAPQPGFGESSAERAVREAAEREAGLGDMWVKTDVATEHSSPNGPIVNRVYYGQKLTIYEKRGEWYRTVKDGFVARWTKAALLSEVQPPAKPAYSGPAEAADDRVAQDAIPNPGENGLTRRDVDTIRKGAKMVLTTRPECSRIEYGDKSLNRPDTYYVMCAIGGSVQNIFFTRAEVDAASLR